MHSRQGTESRAGFAQEAGFKIGRDPDTIRAADVAIVAKARLNQIAERRHRHSVGHPE